MILKRRAILLAVPLALLGPLAIQAQQTWANDDITPRAEAESKRSYDISKQALDSALAEFAQVTGLQLAYDAALTHGLMSNGVQGNFTPRQALNRLLMGTFLQARFTNPATVTLERTHSTELEPLTVVSATRVATPVNQLGRSVTVVTAQEIAQQAALDRNLNSILAKTVLGLAPSTESMSSFGQLLRGRNFLVLIDGIPQSTPLRDGFRDLNSIEASAVERIEVVRGGTAVYGFGAQGGVINIITKTPAKETMAGYSEIGVSVSTEEFSDSSVFDTTHRVSGTQGTWDYLLSGTYTQHKGKFDANGDRIPPNPLGAQGGLADTDNYDVLAKLGHAFDGGRQRVDLMLNHFDQEQDSEYTFGAEGFTTETDPTPDSPRWITL